MYAVVNFVYLNHDTIEFDQKLSYNIWNLTREKKKPQHKNINTSRLLISETRERKGNITSHHVLNPYGEESHA